MPPPKVAAVVLNYNGLADTLRCLESLRAVDYQQLSVILVDNGSDIDPMPEASRRLPGLVEVPTGHNLGYAGGNNRGIRTALARNADYVLVLNNDTVVAPTIVTELVGCMERDARMGVVGPVINFLDEPDRVMTDGVRFNRGPDTVFFERLEVPTGAGHAPVVPVDIVNGCCMMVRASLFTTIGFFDERMFIVHEESDFCLRAQARGFGCAVLGKTLVWHKGSSSFDRTGRPFQRYYDTRNLYFLLRRHAGRAAGSRPWSASWWPFLKYAFYRYAIELENSKPEAAAAVIAGLCDALTGQTGPYRSRRRRGAAIVRTAFDVRRSLAS